MDSIINKLVPENTKGKPANIEILLDTLPLIEKFSPAG